MMFFVSFFVFRAIIREIGPTLPRYMVMMIMILPQRFSSDVRLLVRPTVAAALTVSKTMSRASASVTADKRMVAVNRIINAILTTATALLTACFEMVR